MKIGRRQLLQALGLGTASSLLLGSRGAFGDTPSFPSRIVLYVQPHGHVPNAWNMDVPGAPGAFAERSLVGLASTDLSPTLRPLHPFRDRLLAIEGLANTTALWDIAEVSRAGSGDLNNHQIGVADILTGSRAQQRSGTYCSGGGRSIDQELGARLATPGRYDSRVYGYNYIPNSIVSPFSYIGPGKATPMVSDPAVAFSDLLGYAPAAPGATGSREEQLRSLRGSVLDTVGREYELLAPQLDADGRAKLEQHRALVRELEVSIGSLGPSAKCDLTMDTSGTSVRQFMKLVRLAFACDLTRVVVFSAPVPQCPELGYPADTTFHTYAHQSISGRTSCGQTYDPMAEKAMTDLDAWHAGHVAALCSELDSVAEGTGTLLDHTVVVWITELATPVHEHHDTFTVLAGGCNGFFKTGRYVKYPQTIPSPLPAMPLTGPSSNRLLVSLMQAMGQDDTSFGLTDVVAADGTPISLRNPLGELRG